MNSETERFPGLDPEVREYINGLEEALKTTEAEWEERYERLVDEYRLLLYKRFGRSGERTEASQPLLFDEDDRDAPAAESEDEKIAVRSHSRKKAGRKPLDEKLPREEIIHDIPEEDKICACGHTLVKIGEEISERLQVIP